MAPVPVHPAGAVEVDDVERCDDCGQVVDGEPDRCPHCGRHRFEPETDTYQNPFLVCAECDQPVTEFYVAPGREEHLGNVPCGHHGTRPTCLSWRPGQGCRCDPTCEFPISQQETG